MKIINSRIKKLRNDHNLTQEQMGEILGMKRSAYAHLESYGNFKAEQIKTLCEYFIVPIDYLTPIELSKEPKPDSIFMAPRSNPLPTILQQPKSDFYKTDNDSDVSANELKIIKIYRKLPKEKKEIFFITLLELLNED